MLFRMTSGIVKTSIDHPSALNALSKSLSANLGETQSRSLLRQPL
jgi:hypothetical protein